MTKSTGIYRPKHGGVAFVCDCGEHAWTDVRPARVTFADVEDIGVLSSRWWQWKASGHVMGGSREERALLHRLVCGTSPDKITDHIDRNPLNNRRANLRECTHSQNKANATKRRKNRSGFKGVTKDKKTWVARITIQQKIRHISNHETPEAAARAYDAEAIRLFGEFALLNFPQEAA